MRTIVETLQPPTPKTSTKPNRPALNQGSLRFNNNGYDLEEISTDEESESDQESDIVRVSPGVRSYRDTVNEGEQAIVFSTSITKGIDVRRFNNAYENGTAEFQRFPGKTAGNFKNCLWKHLDEKRPNAVIIQAGGNDLPTSTPLSEIADNLIEAAGMCRRFGVQKICIGGVITRPGLQKRCIELNKILVRRCKSHRYDFINNNRIFLGHLYDEVHLDDFGTDILANNYLDVLCTPIIRR